MLTETYFSSVSGPPIANNTAIAKDAGIYEHTLHPSHSTPTTFKKSSVPRSCLAVGETHVFAAQDEKSTVHVYSRTRGNQEALVTFQERIRSVLLRDDVLFLGTQEGRVITCTGRQVSTPACHVQAVTCMAATPFHLITGSDDSNINVWAIPRLLELDSTIEHEPEQTLSNHRAAVTSVVVSQSVNPDTNICVSASKDKSCIIWNYQHGVTLRTLLFPSPVSCVCLDPCARAFYASSEDGSMYAVELFAEKPLLGPQSAEENSTAVQVSSAFGAVPQEAGAALCLSVSYDGTILLSGHPQGQILRWDLSTRADSTELANLNASVTNLVFVAPLPPKRPTKTVTVVKPFLGSRAYNFTAQLTSELTGSDTRFGKMLNSRGIPSESLEQAILALQQPASDGIGDQALRTENEELWEIVNEQRALQKMTLQRYMEAKSASSR
ncbi:hypothetical protein DL770_000712 [Monosporascus sp. CRB-9-2]|nr:hypothetical protein DL770_000712 [Monosporascus sp. CRB-9-2]